MSERNSPCACGSGKKYKHCHGLAAPVPANAHQDLLRQATSLFKQGLTDEALAMAMKAPNSTERSRILIAILIGRRRPEDVAKALKVIEKWKRSNRSNPEPWARQLEIHIFNRQLALAQRAWKEVNRRDPRNWKTIQYQGLLLQLAGQMEKAHLAYKKSTRLRHDVSPGTAPLSEAAVTALAALKLSEAATGSYPGSSGTADPQLLGQPVALELLKTSFEEWDKEIRTKNLKPSATEAESLSIGWYKLGFASMGRDESADYFRKALQWNPANELARENAVFVLNYSTLLTREEIWQKHLESARELQSLYPEKKRSFGNDRAPDRKLKVAYLSTDFRQHPVAHFILPILQNHDPEQFAIHAYHNNNAEDEITAKARQYVCHFQNVKDLSDKDLESQIMADQIDILVDISGHSGSGRMPMLAGRVAPVQVSWIGYPNTLGLNTIDYRIVDEVTDPKPQAQDFCSEQLLYMPRIFSVYDPLDELPPVAVSPCMDSGHVTFGSFNNLAKINDSLMANWAEILRRVPESHLLIKDYSLSFKHPRQRVLDVFQQHGIDRKRLEFVGYTKDKFEHMQRYQQIDICLDSYPYNGTTTTCDSLMMGVPVVTCAGEDHRSRVTASQLGALQLDSLVAGSLQEYIDVAVGLALDQERLQKVRDGLREKMQASSLMDAAGFTRELESAYQQVWVNWCEAEQAEDA